MKKSLLFSTVFAVWCSAVSGEGWEASGYFTGFECNENGAALTDRDGTTMYLGRSCDAFVPGHGRGLWHLSNAGFLVEAGSYQRGFRGEFGPVCGMSCSYEDAEKYRD
ncbi:hypothetical protein ACRARG_02460 [Pseudooceanicola sp. C21-150M6]|uniref:hypothetical protein n=1 Tax=Pseudooceanicola sp. C21-150M6 TaxID=3434355 RepID=UPI003D7F374B